MTSDPLKLCIVDDEKIVCERLRPLMERSGFDVETFTDSRSALDHILEQGCDILVTDLKMAHPDGLELLELTRERLPDLRVLIITGFATVETAREALKGGATDFIAKPFRMSRLREQVLEIAEQIRNSSR
jgi:DNA-binding NtrC family response regulator